MNDVIAALSQAAGTPRNRELPSRALLVEAVDALRSAFFPGYFDPAPTGVRALVAEKVEFAMRVLTGQIQHALAFAYPERDPNGRAVQAAQAFLRRLPEVRALAATDVEAAYAGDPALRNRDEAILCYPGLLAVTRQRLAHELWMLEVPLLPRIITEAAHSDTGIDIHPGASIGEAFFVDHGTSVVIGETARIGKRVRIYQGVTLGAKSFPLDEQGRPVKGVDRHPMVEDDVVIYAGATILGRVSIGRGSVIGGNVWLTRSVPPGSRITQVAAEGASYDSGAGI